MLANDLQRFVLVEAALVLGLLAGYGTLAMTSMGNEGPIYDEAGHLLRGLSFWRDPDNRLIINHPPLAPAWAVSPLVKAGPEYLTLDQEAWQATDVYTLAEQLLCHVGNHPEAMLRLARRPWDRSLYRARSNRPRPVPVSEKLPVSGTGQE